MSDEFTSHGAALDDEGLAQRWTLPKSVQRNSGLFWQ